MYFFFPIFLKIFPVPFDNLWACLFCTSDNYDPEGYNPESPGLTPACHNSYRQFIPRVQTQRSNLIGLTSNEGQGSRGKIVSLIELVCFLFFVFFPRLDIVTYRSYQTDWLKWGIEKMSALNHKASYLCLVYLVAANIVIQTEPATAPSTPGSNVSRFNSEQDSRKRSLGPTTAEGPAAKKPWMEK